MPIPDILLIGIGGFLGSIFRYMINKIFMGYLFLPIGTLLVNIIGSFLVGFILFSTKEISYELRIFLTIGFAGALTTMSTFAFETFLMFESHNFFKAMLNIGANLALSLFAVYLGKMVVTKFF